MKLVNINITDNASRIIATVPPMTFVKYNVMITAAINMRITRSAVPMFFFINSSFDLEYKGRLPFMAGVEQMFPKRQ